MRIIEQYIYVGPNRRSDHPVIEQLIEFEAKEREYLVASRPRLDAEIDRLLLAATGEKLYRPGPSNPDKEPTAQFCEAYGRTAIALQQYGCHRVAESCCLPTGDPLGCRSIFQYEERETGLRAAALALEMLSQLCHFDLDSDESESDSRDCIESIGDFLRFSSTKALPLDTAMIIAAANRANIPHLKLDRFPFEPIHGDFRIRQNSALKLGHGRYQHVVDGTFCVDLSQECNPLRLDRSEIYRYFRRQGLSIPEEDPDSHNCSTSSRAQRSARRIGFPLALKPGVKSAGKGITLAINDETQLVKAVETAQAVSRRMLLQRYLTGDTYRIIVANSELVGVIKAGNCPADAQDVTDLAHPDLGEACLRMAGNLPAGLVVFTVVSADISRSISEPGTTFVDLDLAPEFDRFLPPESPLYARAMDCFLEWLFPGDATGRIPLVVVTGTNGKTTTSRMIHAILSAAGYSPGLACTDGLYDGRGQLLREGDLAGLAGHYQLLVDPRIDSAVLETARGAVAEMGLGFDRCDIGVCLNVTSDHLGEMGVETLQQMAELKRSIVSPATEAVVLNADDPLCRGMLPFRRAANLGLVSIEHPVQFLRGEFPQCSYFALPEMIEGVQWLVIYDDDARLQILPTSRIPAAFDGLATYNIYNILHASLACLLLGIGLEDVRRTLAGFRMGFETTPGRLNFYEHLPFRVVVDYAHNADGVTRFCEFIDRIEVPGSKFIAFSAAGYNPDDLIRGNAYAAAGHFDYYVCFNYLRNIASEHFHVPGVLRDGLLESGLPPESISLASCGLEALDMILARAKPGDLVVFLAGHSDRLEIRERLLAAGEQRAAGSPV